MYAWRARDVIGLPQETRDADRRPDPPLRARCRFFRFPNVRLNQINWNCELYAHTGDGHRRQRAAARTTTARRSSASRAGSRRPRTPGGSPNLGPGLPLPLPAARGRRPRPSTSTAPSTRARRCHFLLFYEQALRGRDGAAAAEHVAAAARVGRAHRLRLLDARRLPELGHRLRLQALARGPHVGARAAGPAGDRAVAALPRRPTIGPLGEVHVRPRAAPVRAPLARGARTPRGHRAGAHLYGDRATRSDRASASCSRRGCRPNAARAVALGWARCRPREPPPLYSFDADIGRLAVTTPAYSTAVLPVNQRAIPYGGIELARLYDGEPARGRRTSAAGRGQASACWCAD